MQVVSKQRFDFKATETAAGGAASLPAPEASVTTEIMKRDGALTDNRITGDKGELHLSVSP
jgi:hypothetical protein